MNDQIINIKCYNINCYNNKCNCNTEIQICDTGSEQYEHQHNEDKDKEHAKEEVLSAHAGMSQPLSIDYDDCLNKQTISISYFVNTLCDLQCLSDHDLIKNQYLLSQITNQFIQYNMTLRPRYLWIHPSYNTGRTKLYSRPNNYELPPISDEEESKYLRHQFINIVKYDPNHLNSHQVENIFSAQHFIAIMKDFMNLFRGEFPLQIIFNGHGNVIDNEPVFYFNDNNARVSEILNFLDNIFSNIPCLAKPKVVLAFCYGHLCDPTQYSHIQVEALTNIFDPLTTVDFDMNDGIFNEETIINRQLLAYMASNTRKNIEDHITIICKDLVFG